MTTHEASRSLDQEASPVTIEGSATAVTINSRPARKTPAPMTANNATTPDREARSTGRV